MGPSQVFRTPRGELLLFVRNEERPKQGVGQLYVGVRDRVIFTAFVPGGEPLPGELVNDTAGRVEAEVHSLHADQVDLENEVLKRVMKRAVQWLAPSQAEELRLLYGKGMGR